MKKIIFGCLLLGCTRLLCAETSVSSNAAPSRLPSYTLWQTLNLALKQNADVLVARKKIEEADGSIVEARAAFLPSLNTYDNYQRFQSEYATLNNVMMNNRPYIWNISVRVNETAFAGGANVNRMGIARLNRQSRMLDYQATINRVFMDVRIAFYDVLRSRAGISVHQQAVDFLRKQLDYERQRLQVGTGQKLNAMRAEVELSLEQAALLESQNLAKNASLHLAELLAIPSNTTGTPFEIEGQLDTPPVALTEEQCTTDALEHRPELQSGDNDIEVQKKQLVVDRSAILPHVNLFAGYDVVSEPDRSLPDSYYKGYTMGVGLTWNIFDGFAAKGHMRETRAKMEQAEIAEDALRTRVRTEVARAFQDLQSAGETMHSQSENKELAAQSLSLAQANFQEGLITQLDLLQSRLDLTRAQSVELNAKFDYNSALAQLQRAIGAEFKLSMKEGK